MLGALQQQRADAGDGSRCQVPGLGLNELRQHGEEVLRKYRVILADLIFTKRAAKPLVKPHSEQRETLCVST